MATDKYQSNIDEAYRLAKENGVTKLDRDTFAKYLTTGVTYRNQIFRGLQDAGVKGLGSGYQEFTSHFIPDDVATRQLAAKKQPQSTTTSKPQSKTVQQASDVASQRWNTQGYGGWADGENDYSTPVDNSPRMKLPTESALVRGLRIRDNYLDTADKKPIIGSTVAERDATRMRAERIVGYVMDAGVKNDTAKPQQPTEVPYDTENSVAAERRRDYFKSTFANDLQAGIDNIIAEHDKAGASARANSMRNIARGTDDELYYALEGTRKQNEITDPDKIQNAVVNKLRKNIESLIRNRAGEIAAEARYEGVSPDEYFEKIVAPQLEQTLIDKYHNTQIGRYIPKNAFEDILRGLYGHVVSMIVDAGVSTNSHRRYRQEAEQKYAEGQKGFLGSVEQGVKAAVSVADPAFAGIGAGTGLLLKGTTTAFKSIGLNALAKLGIGQAGKYGSKFGVNAMRGVMTAKDMGRGVFVQALSQIPMAVASGTLTMKGYDALTGAMTAAGTSEDTDPLEMGKASWEAVKEAYSLDNGNTYIGAALGVTSPIMRAIGMGLGVSGKVMDKSLKQLMGSSDWWKGAGYKALSLGAEGATMTVAEIAATPGEHDLESTVNSIIKNTVMAGMLKLQHGGVLRSPIDALKHLGARESAFGLTKDEVNEILRITGKNNLSDALYSLYPDTAERDYSSKKIIKAKPDEIAQFQQNYLNLMNNLSWDTQNKLNIAFTRGFTAMRPRTSTFISRDNILYEYDGEGHLLSKKEFRSEDERTSYIQQRKMYTANVDMHRFYEIANTLDGMGDMVLSRVANKHNMTEDAVRELMNKDPMRRTAENQLILDELSKELHDVAFPVGEAHPEQSRIDGEDMAMQVNVTEGEPDVQSVQQLSNEVDTATQQFIDSIRDAEWKDDYEGYIRQGMTDEQAYQKLLKMYNESDLAPLANVINAKSVKQGFMDGIRKQIEQKVNEINNKATTGIKVIDGQVLDGIVHLTMADGTDVLMLSGDVYNNNGVLDSNSPVIYLRKDADGRYTEHSGKARDFVGANVESVYDFGERLFEELGVRATEIVDPDGRLRSQMAEQSAVAEQERTEPQGEQPAVIPSGEAEGTGAELAEEPKEPVVEKSEPKTTEGGIPLGEDGEPVYTADGVKAVDAVNEIYNNSGVDRKTADSFVDGKLDDARKAHDKASKKEITIRKGEGLNAFKARKEEHDAEVGRLKGELDRWQAIYDEAHKFDYQETDKKDVSDAEFNNIMEGFEDDPTMMILSNMPKITPEEYYRETGLNAKDRPAFWLARKEKGGRTVDEAVIDLRQLFENNANISEDFIRDTIIEAISNGGPRSYAKRLREEYDEQMRYAQEADEARQKEEWAQERYGMSYADWQTFEDAQIDNLREKYTGVDMNKVAEAFYEDAMAERNRTNEPKKETDGQDTRTNAGDNVLQEKRPSDEGGDRESKKPAREVQTRTEVQGENGQTPSDAAGEEPVKADDTAERIKVVAEGKSYKELRDMYWGLDKTLPNYEEAAKALKELIDEAALREAYDWIMNKSTANDPVKALERKFGWTHEYAVEMSNKVFEKRRAEVDGEHKPSADAEGTGADNADIRKEVPLTEEQIRGFEDIDDDAKDAAVDFLNGEEEPGGFGELYYRQVAEQFKGKKPEVAKTTEKPSANADGTKAESGYKVGDRVVYRNVELEVESVNSDGSLNLTGEVNYMTMTHHSVSPDKVRAVGSDKSKDFYKGEFAKKIVTDKMDKKFAETLLDEVINDIERWAEKYKGKTSVPAIEAEKLQRLLGMREALQEFIDGKGKRPKSEESDKRAEWFQYGYDSIMNTTKNGRKYSREELIDDIKRSEQYAKDFRSGKIESENPERDATIHEGWIKAYKELLNKLDAEKPSTKPKVTETEYKVGDTFTSGDTTIRIEKIEDGVVRFVTTQKKQKFGAAGIKRIDDFKEHIDGFEKNVDAKPQRTEQKAQDKAAIDKADAELADFLSGFGKKFIDAGKGQMSASLIGLNGEQLKLVGQLSSYIAKSAMARIKAGVHDVEAIINEIKGKFSSYMKQAGLDDEDINDLLGDKLRKYKMRDENGERLTIEEWAKKYSNVEPNKVKENERTDVQVSTSEGGRAGHERNEDKSLGGSARNEDVATDRTGVAGRDRTHTGTDTTGGEGVHELSDGEQGSERAVRNSRNYHATVDENGVNGNDYSQKTPNARLKANLEAIALLQKLNKEGREATKEEQQVLARFSGWGGIGISSHKDEIISVIGKEAYDKAALSANSSYYTPTHVINTLWKIAEKLGFKGGSILEGSAGIGNILSLIPEKLNGRSAIHAVELDDTTGGMLKALYPDAKVDVQGFQDTKVENNSVDLAITNVPFVTDLHVKDKTGDRDLSKKFKNIHDFCIAKNVRKLKEGGIGIFITSSGTLDNSTELRKWLTSDGRADVVGAFRLHSDTFGGTDATSDIIVVRKRINGEKSSNAIDVSTVVGTRTVEYERYKEDGSSVRKEKTITINKYFVEHPENMGGEMKLGSEIRGYNNYRPEMQLLADNGTQMERLTKWLEGMKASEGELGNTPSVEEQIAKVNEKLGEGVREGSMLVNKKGELCVARRGEAVPLEGKSLGQKIRSKYTKQECFKDYTGVKKVLQELLDYQKNNDSDEGLAPLLKKLNLAYDNFVGKYGFITGNRSLSFLKNDVDFANIMGLERVQDVLGGDHKIHKNILKGDVFKERVIMKDTEPKPKTAKDGVIASIYKYGKVDTKFIAEKLGKSEEDVRKEILDEGLGYENPVTGNVDASFVYLSGNVREKIKIAEENNTDGKYDKNIEALKEVMPKAIPAHLIDFNIGSNWIDPKLFKDYIKEKTGRNVSLAFVGGTWSMNSSAHDGSENRAFGVHSGLFGWDVYGTQLIQAAMKNTSIEVSEMQGPKDHKEKVVDKDATLACQAKIGEIREDFRQWAKDKMRSDKELATKIEEVYNDKFNNYVPKSIPDSYVPEHFGGASQKIKLRPHQAKAAIRATMEPVMLAHEVGTGKTFTQITTAMEMRRLGTAKKPMIVVQNATVGQFVASAKALYPGAKILSLDDKDRTASGRKDFYAKIKYNDWDMIIIPQSVLERIPDSYERQMQYISDKIQEKFEVLESMADDPDVSPWMKSAAQKEIDKLEEEMAELAGKKKERDAKQEAKIRENTKVKIEEMLDRSVDDVEDFDQMGIDAIIVDEAHEYKHLGFASAIQKVKGVDSAASKKSQGVYLKCQSVLERTGGKNVIFATGTPISNTAAEVWTFLRYLMPKSTLQEYGIEYFDDFVRNFGNVQQMAEFGTTGSFKEVTRFAGYVNMPELARIWSQVADTVLSKDQPQVQKALPDTIEGNKKASQVTLPQSKTLRGVMLSVKRQLEEFEAMKPKDKKANSHIPVTMFGIAKAAAIDPRLVLDDKTLDDPHSKTNAAVKNILADLNESKEYNGATALFCDMYQNKRSGFNIYEEIKRKLVEAGVPAEQIEIISNQSDKKKLEIFDKVNKGEIRVIMGSTFKLGVGVNIQERLLSIHNLDVPNRPMDYTQRLGRLLRQGNLHKDWDKPVKVWNYAVEDSLDITGYQRLKTKGDIADSIMNGGELMANNQENRTIEEQEDEFGDVVANLSGSQFAILKQKAERDLRKFEGKRRQWEADQIYIASEIRSLEGQRRSVEGKKAETEEGLNAIMAKVPDGKVKKITIGKNEFSDVASMDEFFKEHNKKQNAILEELRKQAEGGFEKDATSKMVVNLDGFDFEIKSQYYGRMDFKTNTATTKRYVYYSCKELGISEISVSGGYLKNAINEVVDNVLSGNDHREYLSRLDNMLEGIAKDYAIVKKREGKPFEFADELQKAQRQVEDYTDAMIEEMAEKAKKYAEMDDGVEEVNLEDMDLSDGGEEEGEVRGKERLVTLNGVVDADIETINDVKKMVSIPEDMENSVTSRQIESDFIDSIERATRNADDTEKAFLHKTAVYEALRAQGVPTSKGFKYQLDADGKRIIDKDGNFKTESVKGLDEYLSEAENTKSDTANEINKLKQLQKNGTEDRSAISARLADAEQRYREASVRLSALQREADYREARIKELQGKWGKDISSDGSVSLDTFKKMYHESKRDNSQDALFEALINKVKGISKRVNLSDEKQMSVVTQGLTFTDGGIYINMDIALRSSSSKYDFAETLLHELIHDGIGSTITAYNMGGKYRAALSEGQRNAVEALHKFFETTIKDNPRFAELYANTDEHELASEVGVKSLRDTLVHLGVMDKFMNVVKKLANEFLGKDYKLKVEERDVLDKIVKDLVENFDTSIHETVNREIKTFVSKYNIAKANGGAIPRMLDHDNAEDKRVIDELDKSEKITGFRNVVMRPDGTFGSPMASGLRSKGQKKAVTKGFEMDRWEMAEENPHLANENGKIDLVKPDGKSVAGVDYNPYIHNRPTKVNKQFKQAWERPDLVYIETAIPKSDLDSGYHAEKAVKSVGVHHWPTPSSPQLLILSRYDKPVRVVPWEEVADDWVKEFKGRGVEFDIVPPKLLPILAERGVEILPPHKGMGKACVDAYESWKNKGLRASELLEGDATSRTVESREIVRKHVEGLGDGVNMHDSLEDVPDKYKAKAVNGKLRGWWDAKTNSVHLYMPNIRSRYEANKVIVHESVGHKGLREVLNTKENPNGYQKFMDGLWSDRSNTELREFVKKHAPTHGWDIYEAVDEWLAREAEKDIAPEKVGLWGKITQMFNDALVKVGLKDASLNINDVRMAIWLSKNRNNNPNDPLYRARLNAMREKLRKADYSPATKDGEYVSRSAELKGTELRASEDLTPTGKAVRDAYDARLQTRAFKYREAFHDNMESLRVLQEEIGGKDVKDAENAYLAENHMTSVSEAQWNKFKVQKFQPLEKAINKVVGLLGGDPKDALNEVEKYIYKKHGLERNIYMYVRNYLDKYAKSEAGREAEANYKYMMENFLSPDDMADMDGMENIRTADSMWSDFMDEKRRLMDKYRKGEISYGEVIGGLDEYIKNEMSAEYEPENVDYSGISAFDENRKEGKDFEYDRDTIIGEVDDMEGTLGKVNVDDIWSAIKNATDFSVDYSYESGQADSNGRDGIKGMYDFYVPLRGFAEDKMEDLYDRYGKDGNIKNVGKVLMSAHGRTSLADSPLATISAMANKAINQGERNKMLQKFYRLVAKSPNDAVKVSEVWEVDKRANIVDGKNQNAEVAQEWEVAMPEFDDDASQMDIADAVDSFNTRMRELEAKGAARKVLGRPNYPAGFLDRKNAMNHAVRVYINGRTKWLWVTGDPRAAQALRGELAHKDKAVAPLRWLKNTTAALATSYSPEFILSNLERDTLFSNANIASKENGAYLAKFTKNQALCAELMGFTGIGGDKVGESLFEKYYRGREPKNETERMFFEFMDNGGRTGFVAQQQLEKHKEALKASIKGTKVTDKTIDILAKIGAAIPKGIEEMNMRAELVNRFATYMTSRQMGRSRLRSVADAKEVSVNFNRHGAGNATDGAWGSTAGFMRDYYMFFNAGMQSMELMYRNLSKDKSTAIKTSAFMGAIPAMVGTAFAMCMASQDDEEYSKIPSWDRRNNICVPIGGGYVKIALPIELRAFWGMGDIMASLKHKRLQTEESPAFAMAGQITQALPLDVLEAGETRFKKDTWWTPWLPTSIRPMAEMLTNTSWTGKPIQKDSKFNPDAPQWTLAYKSTNQQLVEVCKFAHDLTREGKETAQETDVTGVNISPAKMEHLLKSYFSGAYSLLGKSANMANGIKEGDIDMAHAPMLSRVWGSFSDKEADATTNAKYWSYKREADNTYKEFTNRENRVNRLAFEELKASSRGKRAMIYKQYEKRITYLQKAIDNSKDKEAKNWFTSQQAELKRKLVDMLDAIE